MAFVLTLHVFVPHLPFFWSLRKLCFVILAFPEYLQLYSCNVQFYFNEIDNKITLSLITDI